MFERINKKVKGFFSSQRMKTLALMLLVGTTAAMAQNAAGDYSAGTTALTTVTEEIAKYVPIVVKLCYAIAGVVAIVGAISVYIAMNNEEQDVKKKLKLTGLFGAALLVLTACGTSQVTAQSTGGWERFVYFFAEAIRFLSFGGSIGVGIIVFTIVIRTVLLPLFQYQMNSTRKMQEIQPLLKELQAKYPGKDLDSRTKLSEEMRALYKEKGVKTSSAFLPLLIQMPVLMALFQALSRVEFLKVGHFLWLDLGAIDPTYILPVLAALFTFFSSWLTNKAMPERNGSATTMMYVMPVMIFFFALFSASGVALYWVTSNAYQVGQTYLLNNPFKIIAEREAKEQASRDMEKQKRRALNKAQKKKK